MRRSFFHDVIISWMTVYLVYNVSNMPELPEVETVRRGLEPLILQKKIIQVKPEPGKCFQGDTSDIEGAKVVNLRRFGKALVIDLDNGNSMMVHLRMTGQLIWRGSLSRPISSLDLASARSLDNESSSLRSSDLPRTRTELTSPQDEPDVSAAHTDFAAGHPSKNFTAELPNSQTRVEFDFEDGKLFFNDQRKFGFVKILPTSEVEQDKFIASLGPEPWDMKPAELYQKCQRHARAPIKAVLLDQKVIAGIGNIYADESLFYAGVHPETRAGELDEAEVAKILEGARNVMLASIDSGGSTMATYVKPDGSTGDYLELFAEVFRRDGQPCKRCGTEIIKMRVAGRGTHICPKCQKIKDLSITRAKSTRGVNDPCSSKLAKKGAKSD